MNKKTAPRVQLNFAPEVEEPAVEEYDGEELSLPVEVPEVIERDEILQNDIFDNPSLNGIVSEAKEDLIINEIQDAEPQAEQSEKPVKKKAPVKQTQKKKRQLSEEHKAKLALAREKALATRRAKAEEKKKMKQIENETKELKKKKAQKDLEKLKSDVNNEKSESQSINYGSNNYPTSMLTRKDLEEAQLDAIMKYEAIRKARKEEKKKQQMIEQQKKDLQKKIQGYGARDANGRLLNKWDRCY